MQIEFVGGAKTVTGSSFILKDDDFTIMIDCGMFQGKSELKARNMLHLIYDPPKIDMLLLTHAHIDHSGLIPKLVKEGFYGNIFATKPTVDLCNVMLPDSAHIQEMDIEFINRKNKKMGRDKVEPLYTVDDAMFSLKNFVPVNYSEKIQVHPRVQVRFNDAGHILGSSFIEVWVDEHDKQTKIVFSGDIGQKDQAIIRNPEPLDDADILLIESTYGDRLHKNKEDTYEEFKHIILESYNKKGNIIIPAFAVERTQEIIYTLAKLFKSGQLPKIPVYIDSPLAISATEIFRNNENCFDEETKKILLSGDSPLDFPNLTFVKTQEDSKKLQAEKGAIIISASGMCNAGRIKYHLLNNLFRPASSVIFVGYQAEGTLGRRILDGAKQVKIYGEDVAVNAKIHTLGGFSAHADRDGLIEWMGGIKNPDCKVFVVHGEEEASKNFSNLIKEKFGLKTYIPAWGEIIDVKTMKSSFAQYGEAESLVSIDDEVSSVIEYVEKLSALYKAAKSENRIKNVKKLEEDLKDAKEVLSYIINQI